MKIDIITLFPNMFKGPFEESILRRAQDKSLLEIKIHNLRDWALDRHKSVDDRPYGGGAGMIIRVDVIDRALQDLKQKAKNKKIKTILLDATGKTFNQKMAEKLSKEKNLILISGHYEGVDHRVHEHLVDEVISIGNYVLTGGELPAMVITDAVSRLIPGVLDPESLKEESFSKSKTNLEYPQYTRPEEYKGWKVPEVLLSGNHAEIEKWRAKKR
jgi:tRNA (guanine37-N1)-methyltransferase